MNDYIASGFGSQSTDQSIASGSFKPVWHLRPLPLPAHRHSRPHPKSTLHSLCLGKISRDFHLYTPELLLGLPQTIIERILHRVRADRGHEATCNDVPQRNPDAATVWAYSALLDPEGRYTAPDHLVALPPANTLHHLKPDETRIGSGCEADDHPLILLPRLWSRLDALTGYSLLTTLTLDGVNDVVDDTNLLNLRYCTHLTLLWTRGCKITDLGVRLLASALDLPDRKGLCRLRGWFLPGCRGVSDRSMRSLARWPGLCVLDTRGTSVTAAGMGIFNRFSRSYFGGENADMQAVTPGLEGLFADEMGCVEVLEALCLTLMAGDAPVRDAHGVSRAVDIRDAGGVGGARDERKRWWLALHVEPTIQPLEPEWLPYKPAAETTRFADSTDTSGGVYRPGIGMIYGQGTGQINDEVSTFRDSLKTALRIQAEEDGLADPDITVYRWDGQETRKQYKVRVENHERAVARRHVKEAKDKARADLKEAKAEASVEKEREREREKSKAFVSGSRGAGTSQNGIARRKREIAGRGGEVQDAEGLGGLDGQRKLMLVRMVAPNWEDLRWTNATTSAEGEMSKSASASQVRTAHPTTRDDLVADILGTQRTQTRHGHSRPPAQPLSSPLLPQHGQKRPPSQTLNGSSVDMKLEPSSSPPPRSSNPFKRNVTAIPSGVRPLSQTSGQSTQIQTRQTHADIKSVVGSLNGSSQSPGRKTFGEDFDFGSGTKRRFEGKPEGEAKRRGMKMFSAKRA